MTLGYTLPECVRLAHINHHLAIENHRQQPHSSVSSLRGGMSDILSQPPNRATTLVQLQSCHVENVQDVQWEFNDQMANIENTAVVSVEMLF